MKAITQLPTAQVQLKRELDAVAAHFGLFWPAAEAIAKRHGCVAYDTAGVSERVVRTILRTQLRGVTVPEGILIHDHKGSLVIGCVPGLFKWLDIAPRLLIVLLEEWGHECEYCMELLRTRGSGGAIAGSAREIVEALHALQALEVKAT